MKQILLYSGILIALAGCLFFVYYKVGKFNNVYGEVHNRMEEQVLPERTDNAINGKRVFNLYCTKCHMSPDKNASCQITFVHIFERLPSPPELYFSKYIQDSKKLKQNGDVYAIRIDKENESDYEHFFLNTLSEKEIQDIITFIKTNQK